MSISSSESENRKCGRPTCLYMVPQHAYTRRCLDAGFILVHLLRGWATIRFDQRFVFAEDAALAKIFPRYELMDSDWAPDVDATLNQRHLT